MASLMAMCAGLVGPRSENVKASLALVRPKWACKQQTGDIFLKGWFHYLLNE